MSRVPGVVLMGVGGLGLGFFGLTLLITSMTVAKSPLAPSPRYAVGDCVTYEPFREAWEGPSVTTYRILALGIRKYRVEHVLDRREESSTFSYFELDSRRVPCPGDEGRAAHYYTVRGRDPAQRGHHMSIRKPIPWQGPCPRCGRLVALHRDGLTHGHKQERDGFWFWCTGGYVSENLRTRRED